MIDNVKKYLLTGMLGLVLTFAIGFYIFEKNKSAKDLLDYLPANFDQVFYVQFDQDLKNLITDIPADKMSDDFKSVLFKVNRAAVYQYITGENVISFMIANVKDDFDLTMAQKVGLLGSGADYKYENISDNTYIYGTQNSLEYFKKGSFESIGNHQEMKDYISSLKDGKYNTFLGASVDMPMSGNYFSEYIKYLKYSVIVSHIGKDDAFGMIDILFDKDLEFSGEYSFNDTLAKHSSSTDLVYAQLGNILKLIGTSKDKISIALMAGIQEQFPDYKSILSEDDYNKLVDTFDGNISISITPSDNLLGLGAKVVFEKNGLYDVLYKFYPYVKQIVSQDQYSGSLISFEEDNKFGFNVILPYLSGKLDGKIYLEKNGENAVLSVLQGGSGSQGSEIKFDSSKNTILEFYLNAGKIIDTLNQFALIIGQGSDITKNLEVLADKRFSGTINIYPKKLNFTIKNYK